MGRNRFLARHRTSAMALALCVGVVFGGSIPEVGNLAQYYIFHKTSGAAEVSHYWNGLFIGLGVLGIIVCGLALYRRFLQSVADNVVKKDKEIK